MQIIFIDKVFECANEIPAVDNIFNLINELLTESKQNLHCLEIDGIEIYEAYDQYIVDNIQDIKTIVIKVKTLRELLDDTLNSIKEYSLRSIPEIDKMVDEFYHDVSSNTWNKFEQLVEGLQFIVNSLDLFCKNQKLYYDAAKFEEIKQNLLKRIILLQEAVESQDRVRISDVLLYEITPSFTALSREIDDHISNGQVH